MNTLAVFSLVFASASAQLAAWPATSYSPYYQAVLGAARAPVLSYPANVVAESAIPYAAPVAAPVAAAPVYAAPAFAAPAVPVAAAPALPVAAAPAVPVAAAPVLRGPAYNYAPSPVLAEVRPATIAAAPVVAAAPVAPVVAAAPAFAAAPVIAPRVVPAYSPFATSAMFIGSNKAKSA